MNYAILDGICKFARVFHVRDLILAYASRIHALKLFNAAERVSAIAAGAGSVTLLPSRHERGPRGLSAWWGVSCRGASCPHSSTVIERRQSRSGAFPVSARQRGSRVRNARTPGHSTYLIITVPIDTILNINNLQIIQ